METLLALNIGDSSVDALVLEKADSKAGIVRHTCSVTIGDTGAAEAVNILLNDLEVEPESCRVSLSADRFFFRSLSLPFHNRAKIEQVLPLELEELTTFDWGSQHHDFLINKTEDGGADVLTALIDRGEFAEILAALQSCGIDPEIITVAGLPVTLDILSQRGTELSFLLLDIDEKRTTLILVEEGNVVLIRSLPVAAGSSTAGSPDETAGIFADSLSRQLTWTVRALGLSAFVGDSDDGNGEVPCFVSGPEEIAEPIVEKLQQKIEYPVQLYDARERPLIKIVTDDWAQSMNSTLSLATLTGKEKGLLNFRKKDFKKQQSFKELRRYTLAAAIGFGAVCILAMVLGAMQIQKLQREREGLKAEIAAVFKETLPETKLVRPVEQMTVKVDEARELYSGGGHSGDDLKKVAIIAELSTRIPANLPLRITRFVADKDDIRIKGETRDFNTVDNVQKELEKSSYFESVDISSANLAPRGEGVRFELKLEFARQ